MFQLFIVAAVLIAISVTGLSIGIIIKGRFPDTHTDHNANMKKMGITCAKNDNNLCQGCSNADGCR